jgi:ribosomal protein S18
MQWPPVCEGLPWLRYAKVGHDAIKFSYGPISLVFWGVASVYFNWCLSDNELYVPPNHRSVIGGAVILYLAFNLIVRAYKYVPMPDSDELLWLLKSTYQGYYPLSSTGPQRVWIWFDTVVTGIFTMRKQFEFVTETAGMRAQLHITFTRTPTPEDMRDFYDWYRTLKSHVPDFYRVGDTRSVTHAANWQRHIREAVRTASSRAFAVVVVAQSGWTP